MCYLVQVMCSVVWEVGMSEFKVENFSSAAENYTLLQLKGPESYLLLQTLLRDVWNAINNQELKFVGDNNYVLSLILI